MEVVDIWAFAGS